MALTPRERKAALLLSGKRYEDVAASIGASKGAISLVMNDRMRSERIEAAIAQAIARTRDEVFPPRAGAMGTVRAAGAAT